jgi:hypothetical protein
MPIRPALISFPEQYDHPGLETPSRPKSALQKATFKPAPLRKQEDRLAGSAGMAIRSPNHVSATGKQFRF